MGRIGVGYEEFLVVARQLFAQRQTVTVDRVREQLGRGSRTTLLKYLQRWRDEAVSEPEFSLMDLPPQMLSLVEAMWRTAGTQARIALNHEREQLELREQSVKEGEQLKEGQLQALTTQLAVHQQREQALATELIGCKEALARLQVEHQHVMGLAEAKQEALTACQEQIKTLQQKLALESAEHAKLVIAERERYEIELARWLRQLDDARVMLRKTTDRCEMLEKRLSNEKSLSNTKSAKSVKAQKRPSVPAKRHQQK